MEVTYSDARSAEARRISESEIFNEAFNKTRELLITRLLSTEGKDDQMRELFYTRIKVLDEVKNALVTIMNEGEIKSLRFKRNV